MSDCPDPVYCKCGAWLGFKSRDRHGVMWLQLQGGPIAVARIDALCPKCGRTFYWRQTTAVYDRLMRHYPELATGAAT